MDGCEEGILYYFYTSDVVHILYDIDFLLVCFEGKYTNAKWKVFVSTLHSENKIRLLSFAAALKLGSNICVVINGTIHFFLSLNGIVFNISSYALM